MKKSTPHIAIFASGSGSNAVQIISHFKEQGIDVKFFVLSNKSTAPVLEKTQHLGAETKSFDRNQFFNTSEILDLLTSKNVQLIVLAGFLWLVPEQMVKAYPGKIINIHPALLPKYGGKGMFGMRVHEAVIESGEKETGITIHFVDEKYDHGKPILQQSCPVKPEDTPELVAKKVQQLEHKYFPKVVEDLFQSILKNSP